jgi:hypothetical protein
MRVILFTVLNLIFFLSSPLWGMEIRGELVNEMTVLSEGDFSREITMKSENLVSLRLDDKSSFLNGIVLELTLSASLKKYAEGFALFIYKDITPAPDKEVRKYSGEVDYSKIQPVHNKLYIYLYLQEGY